MIININTQSTVVFDLDDTLYKEIDYLKSAYIVIAQELDASNWRATYAYMFAIYREGKNVFDLIAKEFKAEKETLIDSYRNHIPNIKLKPTTEALFLDIKKHGGKIAILTDGRSSSQRNKIRALGLETWIDQIVISEEIGSEKPNEINFKTIEKQSNSSDFLYIADNLKKDFITPNALGWNTIGLIDNGLNIHVQASYFKNMNHRPKHFVFSLSEIEVTGLPSTS